MARARFDRFHTEAARAFWFRQLALYLRDHPMTIDVNTSADINPLVNGTLFTNLTANGNNVKLAVVGLNLQGAADGEVRIVTADDDSLVMRCQVSASAGGLVWGETDNGARLGKLNTNLKLINVNSVAIKGTIDIGVR